MAELTQAQIEDKIADIDAKIATIVSALAGGTAAAQYTDYSIGQLRVSGSQQLQALRETRQMYQDLLAKITKEVVDVATYDIGIDGDDSSEFMGDE